MPAILYVLFLLSLLPIVMAWTASYFRVREFGRFDNNHPRLQQRQQTGVGARALAAQKNCWETLAVFLVIVVIAEASPLALETLTTASLLFLASRLVYLACYLANYAWLRSGVYAAGMCCCLYMFVLSINSYPG